MVISLIALILIGLLAYGWIVYPLLLGLMSRRKMDGSASLPIIQNDITVVIAAHNEEQHIEQRLNNLREALGVAQEAGLIARCRILVGSDGSSDRTVARARAIAEGDDRVIVYAFERQRGKMAVLKELVRFGDSPPVNSREEAQNPQETQVSGFIPHPSASSLLLFTDANTQFAPDALEKLLRHFADLSIGGVCGRLILNRPSDQSPARRSAWREGGSCESSAESAYWKLETWMKDRESSLDSCLGANGAIYAIRKALFWNEIPDNTVVDDLVIGMKVREQGYRMIYDSAAVAYEELPDSGDEWRRRVRIGSGDFQALVFCRRCLLPLARSVPSCGNTAADDSREEAQKAHVSEARRTRWALAVPCWMLDVRSALLFPWIFWSHKVLRWFTPHLLLVLLVVVVLVLAMEPGCISLPFWILLAGYVGAAACALLAANIARLPAGSFFAPLLGLGHFVVMQIALFAGFLRFCSRRLEGHWTRTPRS